MKHSQKAVQWIGAMAVAASVATPLAASATAVGSGGTIYYSGAVVSPPFHISMSVSEKSQGFHIETPSDKTAIDRSTVDVSFVHAPHSSPAAQVAVLVNHDGAVSTPRALNTRFVDGEGHHGASATDSHYRVNGQGGTLSIAAAPKKGVAAESAVTVVVSYE